MPLDSNNIEIQNPSTSNCNQKLHESINICCRTPFSNHIIIPVHTTDNFSSSIKMLPKMDYGVFLNLNQSNTTYNGREVLQEETMCVSS